MDKILFILVITWGISNITSLKVNANSKNIIVKKDKQQESVQIKGQGEGGGAKMDKKV